MKVDRGTCKLYFYNREEIDNLEPKCIFEDVITGKKPCFYYVPQRADQNTVCRDCPQLIRIQEYRSRLHP